MFKGFGFDLDDTLYIRNEVYRNVFEVMQNNVISIEAGFGDFNNVYQQFSIKYYNRFMNGIETKDSYQLKRITDSYLFFNENITREQAIIFQSLYSYFKDHIEISSHMNDILGYLSKKDTKLFILTNGESNNQWRKIKSLNLLKYILEENIFVSDDLNVSKPNSAIYKRVEEKLNLMSDEIIFIGDNWENDIVGPNNSGWNTILLNTNNYNCIPHENLLSVVDTDEELKNFIKDNF